MTFDFSTLRPVGDEVVEPSPEAEGFDFSTLRPLRASESPSEETSQESEAEVFPAPEEPEIQSEELPESPRFGVPQQVSALEMLDQAIEQEEEFLAKKKDSSELEEVMSKLKGLLPKESMIGGAIDNILTMNKTSNKLFDAVAVAETGGEEDPFLRTRVRPKGGSTAYGPVQITGTLAKEFFTKNKKLFDKEELDYLKRFLKQAELFNKYGAEPDKEGYDPRYDYGGKGDLTSPEDRELYRKVAGKMLGHIYKRNNGNIDKTLKEWRFGASSTKGLRSDPKYFKKIKLALGSNNSSL